MLTQQERLSQGTFKAGDSSQVHTKHRADDGRTRLSAAALISFSLIPPVVVTFVLYLTAANEISNVQLLSAFGLLWIPWWTGLNWFYSRSRTLPIFPCVALVYWLYFAFPLFWGDRIIMGSAFISHSASASSLDQTMSLVLIGVSAMGFGVRLHVGRSLILTSVPHIRTTPSSIWYFRMVALATTFLVLYQDFPSLLGEDWRQVLTIIQLDLPIIALALFYRRLLRHEASGSDKVLVGIILVTWIVGKLGGGVLGQVLFTLAILGLVYVNERRKVPWTTIVFVIVTFFFLQVGKGSFRNSFWYSDTSLNTADRIVFWLNESLTRWQDGFTGERGGDWRDLAFSTLSRVSLLTQSANVMELTPDQVPFQNGSLYSYFLISLVPRFLWSDKPTFNAANQFYQVEYGLTPIGSLDQASIAVGTLTEAYINFGYLGVIVIMFLIGIGLDFFQHNFLSVSSGELFFALGVSMIPRFLTIESQLVQYLSGIPQHLIVIGLILIPVIEFQRRRDMGSDS